MRRAFSVAVLGVVAWAAVVAAQPRLGLVRGVVKELDIDKRVVTLTVGAMDVQLAITAQTEFVGTGGASAKDAFEPGTPVFFGAGKIGGKDVLMVMRPAGPMMLGGGRPGGQVAVSTRKPLTELEKGEYKGSPGGLYPDRSNEPPAAHAGLGLKLAGEVRPLDAQGKPAAGGKVVLLSVGMSNTSQEFAEFKRMAEGEKDRNPHLVIVDGAQGGMPANQIANPAMPQARRYWQVVDERLRAAGVTRQQVQVAWLKQADAGPVGAFPQHARNLQAELRSIVTSMHQHFPNLKLVYLSSRTYGGYAGTPLNPEPYAYESGFAVKWLIEEQIKGEPALNCDPDKGKVNAPWLAWGPYLWAFGKNKRADGLSWERSDFERDGTHPSVSGRRKVAEQLLKFFKEDPTAKKWFLAG
jgi:hypothetical protein